MIITYNDQVRQVLKNYITDSAQIVIYPFGKRGRQLKKILNKEYLIKEKYIVDNYYIGENTVIKSDELLPCLSKDMVIMICCENREAKRQIRDTLSKIPDSQIVDVFPNDRIYISNRKEIDIQASMLTDLENIFHGLQRLVFGNDIAIYSILKKYDKEILTEQFERYCTQYISSKSLQRAYSLLLAALLKEIWVDDAECLLGNAGYRHVNSTYPLNVYEEIWSLEKKNRISKAEAAKIEDAYEMRLFTRFPGGHVVPGYEAILKNGLSCKLLQVKNKLAEENNDIKNLFYQSQFIVIRALQELIKRYIDMAYEHSDINIKLKKIARNCECILYDAPRSFEQALQLLWFFHEFMILEGNIKGISLGRMDQYLYTFYEQDMNINIIDEKRVKTLINSFWKKLSFDRKALSFQNVTLGGRDKSENPLTIFFLEAQMETRANQPMLSLRIDPFTSEKVWNKALEAISTGMGVPALFNDRIVIQAKERSGMDKEDAENYSIVGCVEPSIGGKEYSHTEGLRLNVAKILELMLFGGVCPVTGKRYSLENTIELIEYLDFKDFYNQFKKELFYLIHNACYLLDLADFSYSEEWPAPYLSLFMEGTLEKGKDVTRKGTKYCNLSVNFAGMANVVNSLMAIKVIVFEKMLIPLTDLPMILSKNFVGYEHIEKEICNIPKYGNNKKIVDELMKELVEDIIFALDQCNINRYFQAGFYTVALHAEMGKYMLASFDGRKKGMALASSLSPVQGTDARGPLAVFQSITKTPMDKMSNGMVLDLRFSPSFFTDDGKRKLKDAILTYFSMGGMEVQFNVVDQETLKKAQLFPEQYKNLLVRVSGFSTYFVELEKEVQNEIILRYINAEV